MTNEKMLTIVEVAAELNVSLSTLRRWDKKGWLKSIRLPSNQRRYRIEDIEKIVRERCGEENAG